MGCRAKIACGDFLSILQSARTACVVQSAPLENKMLVFKCTDYIIHAFARKEKRRAVQRGNFCPRKSALDNAARQHYNMCKIYR